LKPAAAGRIFAGAPEKAAQGCIQLAFRNFSAVHPAQAPAAAVSGWRGILGAEASFFACFHRNPRA
jgi:hypothetical protein